MRVCGCPCVGPFVCKLLTFLSGRFHPDITVMVDWALKINYHHVWKLGVFGLNQILKERSDIVQLNLFVGVFLGEVSVSLGLLLLLELGFEREVGHRSVESICLCVFR